MKPTVLVADGDVGWLDLAQRLFGTCGYEVQTATDGLDCLEKLRRLTPGVLVLNLTINWGGADGVLARLGEEGIRASVVLTGDVASGTVTERYLSCPGVVAYFRKPLQMSALLEVVGSLLSDRCQQRNCAWSAGMVERN